MNCPKCDEDMEQEEDDPSVGIVGGWYCTACDLFVPYWEVDNEPDIY